MNWVETILLIALGMSVLVSWAYVFWPRSSNRDLSETWEGELEVTILGLGTKKLVFEMDTLAQHVAIVQLILVCDEEPIIISDRKSPWEVISFDREAGKLVVAAVLKS